MPKGEMKKISGNNVDEIDWRIRVFDSLSFPTLILRPDKVIISANHIFLKTFKVSMEDIVGKACHEIFFHSKEPCSEDVCPLQGVLANTG